MFSLKYPSCKYRTNEQSDWDLATTEGQLLTDFPNKLVLSGCHRCIALQAMSCKVKVHLGIQSMKSGLKKL